MDWLTAAKQGSLIAAGVNGVLACVLWLTHRWWSARSLDFQPADNPGQPTAPPAAPRPLIHRPRWFWPVLAIILLVATSLRLPLAGSSLWWDEIWQARHASIGDWRPDKKSGDLKFRETTVAQALWNYRKPTNHPPMALASKACHTVWQKVTGAPPGHFNEFVLRLPGLAASLLGIAMIGLLLRAWGAPAAGLIAAGFLAMHPWHIRYGIDGRGYTFLIPLTTLGVWSLWRACAAAPTRHRTANAITAADPADNQGAWTWWLFGGTQALILWCHLLSVWVCLGLCATGGLWIWQQHRGPARWRRLTRLLAVQVAGAMLLLQLFLPNLLQAMQWGDKNQDGRLLDEVVLLDFFQQAMTGQPQTWGACLVLLTAAGGLATAIRQRLPGAVSLGLLAAAAGFFLVAIHLASFYFYPRFMLALLVPLAAATGLGVTAAAAAVGSSRPRGLVLASLLIAAIGLSLAGGLTATTKGNFSPLRETAAVLQQAQSNGARLMGFGFGAEALQYYLPGLDYARDDDAPEQLARAAQEAQAQHQPLFIAAGYEELNRLRLPAGFALLDDTAQWSRVWSHDGLEPQFTYTVWRTPASPPVAAQGKEK
jgi:hypothetical protein